VKEERKAKDSSIRIVRDRARQRTGEINQGAKAKTNKLPLRLRSTHGINKDQKGRVRLGTAPTWRFS
jgi:hypothetical protein